MRSFLVFLLFLNAPIVLAQLSTEEVMAQINDNVSHEYITCAAYFTVISIGMERSGDKKTAERYEKVSHNALEFGLISAKENRTKSMAERVTVARYEVELKEMMKEIDGNVSNISLLNAKYLDSCGHAMRKPEEVMEKWSKKVMKGIE